MVFFNYSTMQMAAKVVYYGPGLCGKTTNLQWIFEHTSTDSRGEMVSLATETDRTLFFDLLPIDVGSIAGFSTRIQLYTVPGQVFYNTTRKLVLKGVDGVVFVADSQRPMLQANIESFQNLEENLAEMGLSVETIPLVLQYNKRDLPGICSVEELNQALNPHDWPFLESSALNGDGVFETLKMISKTTLLALKKRLTKGRSESAGAALGKRPPARPPARPTPPRKPPPRAATPSSASLMPKRPAPASGILAKPEAPPVVEPAPVNVASLGEVTATPAEEPPAEPLLTAPEPAAPEPVAPEPVAPEPVAPEPVAREPVTRDREPAEPPIAAAPKPPAPRTPAAATAPAVPVAAKGKRRRSAGFDALAELEKLRRETIVAKAKPAADDKNGKCEINRDVQLTLKRADFSRAHRFSLTLRVEDVDRQIVDEAHHLHVDIDDASSLEELLLRINIALNAST